MIEVPAVLIAAEAKVGAVTSTANVELLVTRKLLNERASSPDVF